MKSILLTGATGFLGSHLLERLVSDGHRLIVLKRSFSDTWRIKEILSKSKHYDVDSTTLDTIFKENAVDCILHTAVNYGRNASNFTDVLEDNLVFPIELAQYGMKYGCKCFINTDSFFNKGPLKYNYLSYYTLSKKFLVDALRMLQMKTINCKLEHVYGPADNANKFVTSIISQIINKKKVIDLTDGSQKRDFVYVGDVVEAYSLIVKHIDDLPFFVEFEIGTGNPISIFDMVTLIKDEIPESNTHLNWGALPRREGEFDFSFADTSLISHLGWLSRTSITHGIRQTVKYYKQNGIQESYR